MKAKDRNLIEWILDATEKLCVIFFGSFPLVNCLIFGSGRNLCII